MNRFLPPTEPRNLQLRSVRNMGGPQWACSDYKRKQELQQTIFPEGIYFSKKNCETRTTKINSVFTLIARQKGVLEEKETEALEIIFKNSSLVAPRVENSNLMLRDLRDLCPFLGITV